MVWLMGTPARALGLEVTIRIEVFMTQRVAKYVVPQSGRLQVPSVYVAGLMRVERARTRATYADDH